jgi:GNAT superfamily N-acetyltransferase
MSDSALIQRACETANAYLALGNERWQALGATFIRNRSTPRSRDTNQVGLFRTAVEDLDALLARVEEEFADLRHRRFLLDPLSPPGLAARLALDGGFNVTVELQMLLEGPLRPAAPAVEVREARSESDWEAYRYLDELWWRESSTAYFGEYDRSIHDELMLAKRLKTPWARSWLACVDGEPRAFLTSWAGENGIGMVEDLFTHPDYRHRGLATALLVRAVEDARQKGAGPVLIAAGADETPKHMYAAMGFRPLFLTQAYERRIVTAPPVT